MKKSRPTHHPRSPLSLQAGGLLFAIFLVLFLIGGVLYGSKDPRTRAVSTAACNAFCSTDSDCVTGYCHQPPMPECPIGETCAQVMPRKVCRSSACASDDTCQCPLSLPKKTTTSTFTKGDSSGTTSWQHTSSGSNTLLIVSFSYRTVLGSSTNNVRQVSIGTGSNTRSLTKIRRDVGGEYASELWYTLAVPSGTQTITVQFNGAVDSIVASASTYEGVDQQSPIRLDPTTNKIIGIGASSGFNGRSYPTSFSFSVPTSPSELVASVVTTYSGNTNVVSHSSLQTQVYNQTRGNVIGVGTMQSPVTSTANLSWTSTTGWPWAGSAVSIQPRRQVPTPTPMPLKVFAVGYNPSENGVGIAERYYQPWMGNLTSAQMEDSIFKKTIDAFNSLSDGMIRYSIAKKIRISTFQPYTDGFSYTLNSFSRCVPGQSNYNPQACEAQKFKFDYLRWYQSNKICEQAQAAEADEIWVVVPPYIMTWENIMVGPTKGFDINGPPFAIPGCTKQFAVIHGTYERNEDMLHVIGHRFEATMRYLTATWRAADQDFYWERFAALKLYGEQLPNSPYCGNSHFASNSTQDYVYDRTNATKSTCVDFANFPSYTGISVTGNCTLWGCNALGWNLYWMKHVPRAIGSHTMTSATGKTFSFPRNWWSLWLNPTEAIAQRARM